MENLLNKRDLQKEVIRQERLRFVEATIGLAIAQCLFRTIAAGCPEICWYSKMVQATMAKSFIAASMEFF